MGIPVHKGPLRKEFPRIQLPRHTEASAFVQVGKRFWHHFHDNNFVNMQKVRAVESWNLLSQFQRKVSRKMGLLSWMLQGNHNVAKSDLLQGALQMPMCKAVGAELKMQRKSRLPDMWHICQGKSQAVRDARPKQSGLKIGRKGSCLSPWELTSYTTYPRWQLCLIWVLLMSWDSFPGPISLFGIVVFRLWCCMLEVHKILLLFYRKCL